MGISTSVGSERISRIVGYTITKGDFSNQTSNLPQSIAILGEANTANQGTLSLDPVQVTSAQQAGELYGYGSPIYNMMRILRPSNSDGVGGIPTTVYPQAAALGAVAAARTITPTGAATGNGVHTLVVNGRRIVDGGRYDFTISTGDNVAAVTAKITDTITNVLGSPVLATDNSTDVLATSKWAGLTSEELTIEVDTNGDGLGLVYAVSSSATGAGTPAVTDSLNKSTTFTELEDFNGIPDPETPTGRYQGIIMKPFVSFYGDKSEDPSVVTDLRLNQVTNSVAPAPNSPGWSMEAAANMALLYARIAQDTPHLDANAKSYFDMPVPENGDIGGMINYNFRDTIVKKGSSTVDFVAGKYQVQDLVTTYHPVGETPPQFRYVRNLTVDFNVRFGYYLLEQTFVVDHAIAADNDIVSATKVVKPKTWKQVVDKYAADLGNRALIADVPFMQNSIEVKLSTNNPDRLNTFFRYKRTGIARISSTTAEAGFNFGGN